jgi:hypothetical protein
MVGEVGTLFRGAGAAKAADTLDPRVLLLERPA